MDNMLMLLVLIVCVCARWQNDLPSEEGMSYLQVKNHALLNYTKMELYFTLLKVR